MDERNHWKATRMSQKSVSRCNTMRACNNHVINMNSKRSGVLRFSKVERTVCGGNIRILRLFGLLQAMTAIIYISTYTLSVDASSLDELASNPFAPKEDVSDECEACKLVIGSFNKGMDRTSGGKHEGGDTSWEERNLKSYADSEVRLVEIQEDLCLELTKGKTQCFSLIEDAEQYIEDWWFKQRKNNVRLFDYLCINKLKKCCPDESFGPACKPCSSCNGHGVCDGSGTRQGSGECICQLGYTGENCDECEKGYYKAQSSTAKFPEQVQFSCMQCNSACFGGCSGPSSANCTQCRPGYRRDPINRHCIDINECELNSYGLSVGARRLCPDGTYCQNTEGHYKCADCHRACATCIGHGRHKCITCAGDHFMDEDHNCIYTRDYNRHDPNIRDNESFIAYIWRRFQTDIVLKIMLNILLYPMIRWVVEKVNLGSELTRKVITFLATINIQMEIYPFVQKMVVTNFGKDIQGGSDKESEFDFTTISAEL